MLRKSQRGFTLMELAIVIGILAILAVIVVPNLTGFLRRGERESYNADRRILQAAVTAWNGDLDNRAADLFYPTIGGRGSDSAASSSYISMPMLVTDYIFEIPASASADNGGTGHYTWYVNSKGRVLSTPSYTAGIYP